jgi:hypothetical protein
MSEYVWRSSSKAFRSFRDPGTDHRSASDSYFILSLDKSWRHYSRKRKESRQASRADQPVRHYIEQDDNSVGVTVQQVVERPKVIEEKTMNLFYRLISYITPHQKSELVLKEAKDKAKDINEKLDSMIATLDGEADWFVECHTIASDERND